ncbi:methionine adenosyltransferase [Candidatus Dojkabacteria bacterium]|nr:methionine adenosyltransferase [Candidatus Dojkabacteria bacterium]
MCDQISDAILDACLKQDPYSRVACECATKTGFVVVMGEITTNANINFDELIRKVVLDIGYDDSSKSFDGNTCAVQVAISKQSTDISMGVDNALEKRDSDKKDDIEKIGAGDQGMMFGFACDETPEYMPMPIYLSHLLTKQLAKIRKEKKLKWIYPDGKSQVTVEYHKGKPTRVDTILVSTQHSAEVSHKDIEEGIKKYVIDKVIPKELIDSKTKIYVNPTGRFVIGGPKGDAGVTGRKIIVDTYGGMSRHGGGAFSGKDCTKVDRSAAYMTRYIAKNIVASGLASRCEIQVSYAIGVAKPLSIMVDTFGTGKISDEKISKIIDKVFDLRPGAIIRDLDLRKPIFQQVASYGHFGRDDLDLPWERLDKVSEIKEISKQKSF